MPDYASEQERLVGEVSKHAFGAPFVFTPDNHDQGMHEPFDLAWFANGCLVAVALTVTDRSHEKVVKHNIDQSLKGWARAWGGGQRLTGQNAYQTFAIGPEDVDHVILLGLGRSNKVRPELHHDRLGTEVMENAKVRLIATLPEAVFHRLVERRGTIRDLAGLLHAVRRQKIRTTERCLTWIDILADRRWKTMSERRVDVASAQTALDNLTRLIRATPEAYRESPDIAVGWESLFDLDWKTTTRVAIAYALVCKEVGRPDRPSIQEVKAFPYWFVLWAAEVGAGWLVQGPDRLRELNNRNGDYSPIAIGTLFPGFDLPGAMHMTALPRRGRSGTAHFLDKIA